MAETSSSTELQRLLLQETERLRYLMGEIAAAVQCNELSWRDRCLAQMIASQHITLMALIELAVRRAVTDPSESGGELARPVG